MLIMLNNALEMKWEDFSELTIKRAKWVLIDALLVMVYGIRSSPESKKFLLDNKLSVDEIDKGVQVPGSKFYLSKTDAEILFGSSIVCNEMDEGSQYAKGHPSAHIIPAMLIESENSDVDGKLFLRALIIGYEIAARFGYASKMKDEMHPHGTWGIIGAAAALGILRQQSKKDIIESVLLAASLPLATSWESAVTGMTVRNLYAGLGNLIASYIPKFCMAGFESSEHVVKHIWGHIMSNGMDENLFVAGLNNSLLIDQNYFKLYPACRFSHSAIEALLKLKKSNEINVADIELIEVKTYSLSARLKDPDPKTLLAARFSIPFLLSVLMYDRSLFEISRDEVFQNLSIRNLAKEIQVYSDPDMSRMLPEKRPAKVKIRVKNGEVLSSYVDDAPDGFDFFQEGLKKKHNEMMKTWQDRDEVRGWLQRILQLDKVNGKLNLLKIM